MRRVRSLFALTAWLFAVLPAWQARPALAQLPAFPGAVGQGALARGGRSGDVYHVSNLLDYDSSETPIPGSLRLGIASANISRTIVFDVGGALELKRPLVINKDNLTLAGQTSPSGVTVWGYNTLVWRAEDVIVRFMRFRTGDFNAQTANPDGTPTDPIGGRGNMDLLSDTADALSVSGGSDRVILDHISASWGMDETLSVTISKNVTVQNSIISHSLNDSFHHKGTHGYGSLVRGEVTPNDQEAGVGGYTLYGNLWAHHMQRNPSFGGQQYLDPGQPESDRRALDVNLVNNVVYDRGSQPTHRNILGQVRANIVGNYYVNGPQSSSGVVFNENADDVTQVYQQANFLDADKDRDHDGTEIAAVSSIARAFVGFEPSDSLVSAGQGSPFNFFESVQSEVVAAEQAYDRVIDSAGAALWRDAIDARLIDELTMRSGAVIDSQEELRDNLGVLSGIDDLPTVYRPPGFDTDADGMPDAFELDYGLDPLNPRDRNAKGISTLGYTNLEFYLDSLVSDLFLPPAPGLLGDFDGDGQLGLADIDLLGSDIARGSNTRRLDVTGDGGVTSEDRDMWLRLADRINGDADLSGGVDFSDFVILADNFGSLEAVWSGGDFDTNGEAAFPDFAILAENFGGSSGGALMAVPEPSIVTVCLVLAVLLSCCRSKLYSNGLRNVFS